MAVGAARGGEGRDGLRGHPELGADRRIRRRAGADVRLDSAPEGQPQLAVRFARAVRGRGWWDVAPMGLVAPELDGRMAWG
jgi:hypothetical protein